MNIMFVCAFMGSALDFLDTQIYISIYDWGMKAKMGYSEYLHGLMIFFNKHREPRQIYNIQSVDIQGVIEEIF